MAACVALSSCSAEDPIRQYTVAKPPAPSATAETPAPMGLAWFFKVTGPEAAVSALVEPFARLVGSVKFDAEGRPEWALPEGWSERRDQGIRYATLTVPGDKPLEVTVIPLPAPDPTSASYLQENYNRWRGQIGLAPLDGADWRKDAESAGELSQIDAGGRTITVVNLKGTSEKEGEVRMLAALVPASTAPPSPTSPPVASRPAEAPPADDLPFTFTLPDGWQRQPAGQFQTAKFITGDTADPLVISVSLAGGDLAANVNRWREQVQLSPIEPAEIDAAASPITVAGISGKLFAIEGPTDAILGVIVPRESSSWFFKAMGPKAVAQEQRERFEAFVKSIQFRN